MHANILSALQPAAADPSKGALPPAQVGSATQPDAAGEDLADGPTFADVLVEAEEPKVPDVPSEIAPIKEVSENGVPDADTAQADQPPDLSLVQSKTPDISDDQTAVPIAREGDAPPLAPMDPLVRAAMSPVQNSITASLKSVLPEDGAAPMKSGATQPAPVGPNLAEAAPADLKPQPPAPMEKTAAPPISPTNGGPLPEKPTSLVATPHPKLKIGDDIKVEPKRGNRQDTLMATVAPAAKAPPVIRQGQTPPVVAPQPLTGPRPAADPMKSDVAEIARTMSAEPLPMLRSDALSGVGPSGVGATSPIARPELAAHVARQIADIAQHMPARPVEISLSPEELGRVRLSLSTHDAGIVLNVLAERPETVDLLKRHINQLGQQFQSLGYANIAFSFGQGENNAQSDKATSNQPPDAELADTGEGQPLRLTLAPGATGVDLRL